MEAEQNHKEAEILAARARITVAPERIATLAAGLTATRGAGEVLGKYDLGRTEPASRFRAPAP